MTINFNPNLPPNDSLTPEQITTKVRQRNEETQDLAQRAYEVGGVPISAAHRAARHLSTTRQTPEAKKDIRDAATWWKAKRKGGSDD